MPFILKQADIDAEFSININTLQYVTLLIDLKAILQVDTEPRQSRSRDDAQITEST